MLDHPLATDRAVTLPGSPLRWYEAADLTMEGIGFEDPATTYSRLPARAQKDVTPSVWNLGRNTAGICVRFVTDATTLSALWDGGLGMRHMAATGSNGLDLYRRKGDKWVYCGTGRPADGPSSGTLVSGAEPKPTEYLLYLPLYGATSQVKLGIAEGSRIAPAAPRLKSHPIVFYGTSITQGGCASRAGMSHPAIIGRWLDRETINLGFSGSGKMEMPMVNYLAEIDASIYVLECLPNMTIEMMNERLQPFVKALREKRPGVPILLVENVNTPHSSKQNQVLWKAYQSLQKDGVKRLHYLRSEPQVDGEENGTVDGVHPTDLGFFRMAKAYTPVLKGMLEKSR